MRRNTLPTPTAILVLGLLLPAHEAAAGSILTLPQAQPRTPQVAVQGTGLQQMLDAQAESIVVSEDQIDVGLFSARFPNNSSPFTIVAELIANERGVASGLYNGHDANPALMEVFPAVAVLGWFASITFRSSPDRAIVTVFDADAVRFSSTTWLGADRRAVGMYVAAPDGPLFSQDARNPSAAPQLLFYRGTGVYRGSAWFGAEDQSPASGSDADFDDVVWSLSDQSSVCIQCDPNYLAPVRRSTWGELKSRFR